MLLFHSRTHSRNLWVCNYTRTPTAVNSFFLIERMETFVGPATAARKRFQITVKLQLQQAPRVVRASPGSTGD